MKQYIKSISNRILERQAPTYFFARKGNDSLSMQEKEESLRIHEILVSRGRMQAVIQVYQRKEISLISDNLILPKGHLTCKWFESIQAKDIEEILLFLVTVNDMEYEYGNVLEQFYASMWLTSYLDCYRSNLIHYWEKWIHRNEADRILSTPLLGPGYFTMGIDQMESFYQLLPCDRVGVTMNSRKVFQPEGTCCGLLIAFHDDGGKAPEELHNPCRYCQSNRVDCSSCYYTINNVRMNQ